MWHLVLLLFGYDFTLDESSVERDEKTHQQVCIEAHPHSFHPLPLAGMCWCKLLMVVFVTILNEQEFANSNAKAALKSLCRMGGFRGLF